MPTYVPLFAPCMFYPDCLAEEEDDDYEEEEDDGNWEDEE